LGSTAEHIVDAVPPCPMPSSSVRVLGGYIATTGVLLVYVANTGVRNGDAGALVVLAAAGVTSLGWMSALNFMIRSTFKWLLLALDGRWVLGMLMALAAR
jgi:hypothetical protein